MTKRMNTAGVSLATEVLDYLRRGGVEVTAAPGENVVRRGDPGRAFWVVLEGSAEVRLTGADGTHLTLARMGPGATFGEMALITDDPVSADVVALAPTRLLRYPGELFSRAVGECGPLRTLVMARLAANLKGTNTDAWNFYQKAKALNVLMDPHLDEGPIVAESGAMKPLRERVERLGPEAGPVLISGDPGAGKLFLASRVHEAAGRRDAPFIAVDCRTLAAADATRFVFGTESGVGDAGGEGQEGALIHYGALQLAHGGTLVLRHFELLPRETRDAVAAYLRLRRDGGPAYPVTRVVATTALPAGEFTRGDPALGEIFAEAVLSVPPMGKRRKDVVPLARLFLAQGATGGSRELSRSAEHVLVSMRYEHRNAAELREAVAMAALIADEPRIQAEHIFAGPKDEGGVQEIELTPLALVRHLTSPATLRAVRAVVFAAFAAIVAASLLRPAGRAGAVANAVTWSLWEPALFVGFLLVGRLWCTVCPISTAGRLAQRAWSLDIPPGAWIKNNSGWLIIAGFLLIVWLENTLRMTERPRAAGLLLLALFAGAMLFGVLYRRETWCRYVCPLGNLGAVYALGAVLSVRANPNVCATACTSHECFKGSGAEPGCPVFHHPLYASDAQACKLCFRCLRVCPHGSARLGLRLPLQSIWAQADVGNALVPVALFIFFFAPAMLASQGQAWTATVPGFTATALAALLATAAFRSRLPFLLSEDRDPSPLLSTRVAFALLVLAWGPAMAYQFQHIPLLDQAHLHAEPGSTLARFLPSCEVSLLWIAQVGVIILAALGSWICFGGILSRLKRSREEFSRRGWNLVMALCLCYLLGTLAIVLSRGLHY